MTDTITNLGASIDAYVAAFVQDESRADPTTKGRAFAKWCCEKIFDLDSTLSSDAIKVGGNNDYSMDAFVEGSGGPVVLQSKYNSHDWSEVAKFKQDMERLCSVEPTSGRQEVLQAAAKIRTAIKRGEPIRFIYVTNSSFSGQDLEKIGQLSATPAPVEAMELSDIDRFLGEKRIVIPSQGKGKQLFLRPAEKPLEFQDSIVFPAALVELAGFVDRGKDYLFASNVRNLLLRSKVNEEIKLTVRNTPARFWQYNNGITLVCDKWDIVEGQVRLTSPQVVNGCQTAHSVRNVITTLDEEQREAIKGEVLVRVIREASDEERIAITRNTNRQNAVRAKDFFALDDFQGRLALQFEKLGYYYEIQTGSWDQLGAGEHDRFRGDSRYNHLKWTRRDYRIPAIEAVKCHSAAFRWRIAVCYSNPAELAPGGPQYDQIFTDELPEDAEPFLLPYLVLKDCEERYGYGKRSDDFHARSRYLFVATAFRVLHATLAKAELLESEPPLIQPSGLPKIREILSREKLSDEVLDLTEEVMKNFFRDSWVKKQVGQDIFQFLKGPVEREDPTRILVDKINDLLTEQAYRKLVSEISKAVPA